MNVRLTVFVTFNGRHDVPARVMSPRCFAVIEPRIGGSLSAYVDFAAGD